MASEMGCNRIGVMTFLWVMLLGVAKSDINIKGAWKKNFGWELSCDWKIPINETLQSIMLYRNDQIFMVYRPKQNGLKHVKDMPSEDFFLKSECVIASPEGQRGKCLITFTPFKTPTLDRYACELSKEAPTFLVQRNDYTPIAVPSDALVRVVLFEEFSSHQSYNCTSSGWPAPTLVWTFNGMKVPANFSYTTWNPETKLFDAWSSYTPNKSGTVTCTPEVITDDGQVLKGKSANAAERYGATKNILMVSIILALLS